MSTNAAAAIIVAYYLSIGAIGVALAICHGPLATLTAIGAMFFPPTFIIGVRGPK